MTTEGSAYPFAQHAILELSSLENKKVTLV